MHQSDFESHYKTLSDYQLKQLAQKELQHLTTQARSALQRELDTRQLQPDSEEKKQEPPYPIFNFDAVEKHILQYIMEEKQKGSSDAYITGGLLERGMEQEQINWLLSHFNDYLTNRKEKMNSMILTGNLQWVSGIALLQLPLNRQQHLAILIIAYALLLLGILRTSHGFFNKRKIIKAEKQVLIST